MWYNFNKRLLLAVLPPLIKIAGFQPPSVAAVCAIIEKDDKILTIDLAYKQGLSLPGGGVNAGESLEEALKREIKEETNLDLKKATYLGSSWTRIGKLGITSACYLCTVSSFKPLISSSEGEIFWESPKKVFTQSAYTDVKEHLAHYFGFTFKRN